MLNEEWALRDIGEALAWLVACQDDLPSFGLPDQQPDDWDAPFPLLLPRGHLALFEAAAERLLRHSFGHDHELPWSFEAPEPALCFDLPAIREVDAIIVETPVLGKRWTR